MPSVRDFYDGLAADYHRIFPDWDASMARQAEALDGLVRSRLGSGPHRDLDCSCPIAASRAGREGASHGLPLVTAAADMRALPFRASAFDVVVCADDSLAHLVTDDDVGTALAGLRRVLRDDGLLTISIRDYDELRADRPTSTSPQLSTTAEGRAITFQLWHWHEDGERYDQEYFQLLPVGDGWEVRVRRVSSWALTRGQLSDAVADASFAEVSWHPPERSGFHQPVLTARREPAPRKI